MSKFILLVSSFLFSSSVFSLSIDQQRSVYNEAKSLQAQERWGDASEKLDSIPDYPLNYLLEYQNIRKDLSQYNPIQINDFIDENKPYRTVYSLQREYMYYLAKQKSWDDFLAFYPQLPYSTELKCFYFQAKMSQGKQQAIFPEVKKVWLNGYSQPNACDAVFNYYLNNKMISQALIWQRFALTFNSNKKPLMNYLTKLMQEDNKQLAQQLYALNGGVKQLEQSELFNDSKDTSYPFLKVLLKRLARTDIKLAVETYDFYDKKIPFSDRDAIELKEYFVYRALIYNKEALLPWVDKELPKLSDEKLVEQRIRYAIKYNNWSDIEYWINVLPKEVAQETTWVYWKARVLEEKNKVNEANKLYKEIAGYRKYYSFLAAQKLGLSYQLNADIVEPKTSSLKPVQARLDHIEELNFHQYTRLVKLEWEALLKGRDVAQQRQIGLYAVDKGWAHLSVLASIRSKSWSAINIRFPEVKPEIFATNATKYQLPSSYIYAITRQESAFDQYANSPVGATGYMQLMPATAKETARKIGLTDYKKKAQLTEGEINVQLGTAYFDGLLKRYQGNRILATAAYNAGPHRVDRWKKDGKGRDSKALSMDSWVETIPYKETRRYVKNVLAYNVIYQHVLQKPMEFFNQTELSAYY